MEQMQKPGEDRRGTAFGPDGGDQSLAQVKAELVLINKKYERLLSKEVRMQVRGVNPIFLCF